MGDIRVSSLGGVPFGDNSSRPSTPVIGQTYYNGSLGYLEIYTDAGWIAATGANDFSLNLSGVYTSVTFTQSYSSGSYSIVSNNSDSTLDIYAFASDGSLAGYTNTKSFSSTKRFVKMVIIGGTVGDVLAFSYKTTFVTVDDSDESTAGPVVVSVSPTSLPSINDTTVVTGRNFASNCTVTFTSANISYTPTSAKSVVRSNATSLIVARPDNLPTAFSPYTITVENPGVTNPTGTNSHILSNAITAGTNPAWQTGTTLPEISAFGNAYSTTLVATDTEGSDIDYTLVSGTFPSGISLNSETGVISGSYSGGAFSNNITIRATDAGGNFLDRTFTLFASLPAWVTGTTLPSSFSGGSYSVQLSATDNSAVSYSVSSGTLPSGLTLSSSGLISGTITQADSPTPNSFTVRATDAVGNRTDRTFSIIINVFEVQPANNSSGQGNWGYNGSNTDAYTITPGSNVTLTALSIWNKNSGAGTFSTASIRVWQGSAVGSNQIHSTSITGRTIYDGAQDGGAGAWMTKLAFNSGVPLTAGVTYTIGIVWEASQGFTTYTSQSYSTSRTVNGIGFTMGNASFGGGVYANNGTNISGSGQIPKFYFV